MPRISYVDFDTLDPKSRDYLEYARQRGTPRPESQAVRAHVPAVLDTFTATWRTAFDDGVLDNAIKEFAVCTSRGRWSASTAGLSAPRRPRPRVSPRPSSTRWSTSSAPIDTPIGSERRCGGRRRSHGTRHWRTTRFGTICTGISPSHSWSSWGTSSPSPSGQQRWIKTLGLGHREYLGDTTAGLAPVSVS